MPNSPGALRLNRSVSEALHDELDDDGSASATAESMTTASEYSALY